MGLEILDTFEKINANPEAVTDAEMLKLNEELDGNLETLGARKNDVLGGVSRMIEQAQEAIRKAVADKNEAAKVTAVERLNLLRGMETKLISVGATNPIQDRGISARKLVEQGGSAGAVVGSNVAMTAKNLGLLVQKHPLLTLGGGFGLYKLYEYIAKKSEMEKKSWYVRWPAKIGAVLLSGIGLNMAMQAYFPNEAATLAKKEPDNKEAPEKKVLAA